MTPIELTKENFSQYVKADENTVLVDFWAAWCGPCRMMSPVIDELAEENRPGLVVGKINVDDQGDLAARFGIMSIPTIIVFKNGQEAGRAVGVRPKASLEAML